MSLVSLRFICLTHPPCLHSESEMLLCVCACVCVTLTCGGVYAFDGHTAALHLSLYGACKHNDAHRIDFLVPFYNYVSSLFIHPPPLLSLFLSFILSLLSPPSLFYFSNSIPLIHFYASLCPCLLSRPFLFFSLFDLNFLISSLIYVTPLGFVLHPPPTTPPPLSPFFL